MGNKHGKLWRNEVNHSSIRLYY